MAVLPRQDVRRVLGTFVLLALIVTWTSATAQAHNLELTETLILIKEDGRYQIDMICDLDALALGAPPSTDNELLVAELEAMGADQLADLSSKLQRTFERRVRVLFDGQAMRPQVSFPDVGTPLARDDAIPSMFGVVARLEGRVPAGSTTLQMRASRSFPPLVLTFIHLGHTVDPARLPVEPGSDSAVIRLDQEATGDEAGGTSHWQTLSHYVRLGFHHILPAGLDHVLFVLGLFLLNARFRPLLYQVTAFTLAHAITLALATLGMVTAPPQIVEPLIAFSIAWVALENLWWSRRRTTLQVAGSQPQASSDRTMPTWRLPLIFCLGLLHGLGFAGALAEVGLPAKQLPTALLSFNVGIEIGQISVLALAFVAVGWWRHRPWYGSRVVLPGSLAIALCGLWWTFERLIF